MSDRAECDECRAIAEELSAAYAEVWMSITPEVRDAMLAARRAVLGMVGGAEEDAERAEEVLGKFQFRMQQPESLGPSLFGTDLSRHPRIRQAARRMFRHLAQSGHSHVTSHLRKFLYLPPF